MKATLKGFDNLTQNVEKRLNEMKQELIQNVQDAHPDHTVVVEHQASAEVFTLPNCPYCIRAKKLLEQRGVAVMEISAKEHRDVLMERVTAASGVAPRTAPQIFLNGAYIGGFDNLEEHYEKLDAAAAKTDAE